MQRREHHASYIVTSLVLEVKSTSARCMRVAQIVITIQEGGWNIWVEEKVRNHLPMTTITYDVEGV